MNTPTTRITFAGLIALGCLGVSSLSAQTITGDWYFHGLSVMANPGDVDPDSGLVAGTVNIADNGGGSFTATPGGTGWLGFDAAGSATFTQAGNRYTRFDESGGEFGITVFEVIDADTVLWLSASGENNGIGSQLFWFDGFAGVLTRELLPVANASGWAGNYASFEIAVSTDTAEGLEFLTDALSVTAGGGEGEFVINADDTFSLIEGGQYLYFLETSSGWMDQAVAVQLAGGGLAYAYFGVADDGTAITFADIGIGTLTAVPEPSTYAAIFGSLALGGVWVRRRLFPLRPLQFEAPDDF